MNTEEEIQQLCQKYQIRNYQINNNMSINVDGDVVLSNINLRNIPLKFLEVTGQFYCSNSNLTSLKGCPCYVGGDFWCMYNVLTSLEHLPHYIGGFLYCTFNCIKQRQSLYNISVNRKIISTNLWKF